MFWSNKTEKGPKSALKVHYALEHKFLIILCSFRRPNSKVNDILKFWEPRNDCVIHWKPCCKEQCYNSSLVNMYWCIDNVVVTVQNYVVTALLTKGHMGVNKGLATVDTEASLVVEEWVGGGTSEAHG